MGKQEDLEFVDLLENMSPEELSSLCLLYTSDAADE